MSFSFAARADKTEELKHFYTIKLNNMSLAEVVEEFISYLDYTEESESGREFHPITIGSCRCLMSEPLDMVISKLRELSSDNM